MKDAFVEFVENVPFYGAALLCVDHPEVQSIIPRLRDRRVVTYGFAAQADVRGSNLRPFPGGCRFDVSIRNRAGEVRTIDDVDLPMPGRHNVQNALAAIGVAAELGIADEVIAHGFEKFHGVKRRFTKVGEVEGAIIIDDYGHHPVEIRAVLGAARESVGATTDTGKNGTAVLAGGGRVIAVVQPHRYSRLHDLMGEFQLAFNNADIVYVAPVYAAGEAPIEGVSAEALAEGLKARGHRAVATVDGPEDLARQLRDVAARGDIVVCLGAGDITRWAAGLAEGIRQARLAK